VVDVLAVWLAWVVHTEREKTYGALDALGDVVGGVLDGVHGRADDALVSGVGVGSRHFDCWLEVKKSLMKKRLDGGW